MRAGRWLIVVLWCLLIYGLSAAPALAGAATRSLVAELVGRLLALATGVGSDAVAAQRLIDAIHWAARKTAHLLLFGTLAALCWWALEPADRPRRPPSRSTPLAGEQGRPDGPRVRPGRAQAPWARYLTAWLLATLYAATDEWHQRFVPGRTGSLTDVGIDAVGALLALAGIGVRRARRRGRQRRLPDA
ncbi:MAG TPA: VanZ family protein [Bacillota bacterium]